MPLLLVLVVGVVSAKKIGNHNNDKPMISDSNKLRICADLCSSGLGGENCGAFCLDLIPKAIPKQYTKDIQNVNNNNITRWDACPLLCKNGLGYPLCKCSKIKNNNNIKNINFNEICEYYCIEEHWWLHGCPACELTFKYGGKMSTRQDGVKAVKLVSTNTFADTDVDWNKWCDQQCANSNGGSACNCDLLPFSLM